MTARLAPAALDDLPAWRLSDAELCDRYLEREREITRLQAEAAADLAEIDRRRAHPRVDLAAEGFVRHLLGVSGAEARRRVTEARGLVRWDGIREAFSEARIDRVRVRLLLGAAAVSEEVFSRDEQTLVEAVSGLSARDAGRAVAYWTQAADHAAAVAGEREQHERRRLSISTTFAGMVRIDADLDPESGAIVRRALDTIVDPTLLDPADPRTLPQRRADALADLCADHLAHGDTPTSGGVRPHVTLTVSAEVLATGVPGEPCELDEIVITPQAAQRIACDATITPIAVEGGSIIDVGRARRTIPAALRRALELRDRHCTAPGCERPARWCDAHHIVHWALGGLTSLANLRLLCRRHHRLEHDEAPIPRRE